MRKGSLGLTLLTAASLVHGAAVAHCGEPDLKLSQLKSIAVVASLSAHGELELTIDALQRPFEEKLKKRGLSLDKSIGDNYVKVTAFIDRVEIKKQLLYIVNFSVQYNEQCITSRAKQEALCTLWEFYEPTETFTTPEAARKHVLATTDKASQEFMAAFEHKGQ